jgi:hypothetical protein
MKKKLQVDFVEKDNTETSGRSSTKGSSQMRKSKARCVKMEEREMNMQERRVTEINFGP